MKIADLHPVERPREKLQKLGPERLKNAELLAILLNTGLPGMNVVELSEKILQTYPLSDFWDLDISGLSKIKGIGIAKAAKIVASRELLKRSKPKSSSVVEIHKSKDIVPLVSHIANKKKEHLIVIYLNTKNEVLAQEIVSVGTLNGTTVHPREVFEPAFLHNAASVALAHNHPSGDPTPSDEDYDLTNQLVEAGQILGIEVLDHIVIAQKGFKSILWEEE